MSVNAIIIKHCRMKESILDIIQRTLKFEMCYTQMSQLFTFWCFNQLYIQEANNETF